MGINDIGFPLGIVGNHLASASGGWEPQRQYNWVLTIAGIGQGGGGGGDLGSVTGALGALGSAIGAVGSAISAITGGGTNTGGGSGGIIELALDSSALPTTMVSEIELPYGNERRYVAGRASLDAIPLVVKDMVDIGVATACKTWHEQVHNPATFKVGLARDYKKIADLVVFSPEGSIERSWRLHGCWPTAVSYGALDMNSDDIVRIEMNLRFDRAEAIGF